MTNAERFRQLLTDTSHNRENLRIRSTRAAIFTGVASFSEFALRIGSMAILARLIIPEHFGLVMMATAVTAVADQMKDLGLSSATVQRKEITHAEVSNLFWVNVTVSLFLTLVVCGLSPLIASYYRDPRLIAITCIVASNFVLGGLMVQHQALLTRQLRLGKTSSVRLATSAVSTLLAIALAWMDFGYWAIIYSEVTRNILLVAGMWLCYPWAPSLPNWKTDIRGLIGFGAHLTVANIFSTICGGADRFLLGRFWGAAPVAMFRQANQLISAPTDQLLSPLYSVTQPGLSTLQSDPVRYQRFYKKVLSLVCIITMPLSLFVSVYAPEIIMLLLGSKWAGAGSILSILSLGTFIKQAVGSTAFILITRGHSRTYLFLTVLHNLTWLALACVAARWGTTGLAFADIAATYILIAPRLHYSLKGSPISVGMFFSAIARPAIASIAMWVTLLLLRSFFPPLSAATSLATGCIVALVVFPAIWLFMPGGRTELLALISDVRAAARGNGGRIETVETEPVAS